MTSPSISVLVPLHNEQMVLPELLLRIGRTLSAIDGGPHEMIFVDDGSADGTLGILEEAARLDPRISVIVLSRNFGHQAALSAGLDHVSGDVTVVLDGDLQDPPEMIPSFIDKYQQGFDVVYALRTSRKESFWLKLCFFLFYRLMSSMADTKLPIDAGDFGLVSRRVVDQLRSMPEHHRYLRGMRSWVGFRQVGIAVERSERFAGESKYGALTYLRLASDAIFSFSTIPIRAAALIGFVSVILSGLFTLYAIVEKLVLHHSPRGFTAQLLVTTFLSGTLLLFLGIIGEYVGRIYEEVKGRPVYVVQRVIGNASLPRSKPTSIPTYVARERQ
jgi:polyisoprenyl-phosphate glycosyltransferase